MAAESHQELIHYYAINSNTIKIIFIDWQRCITIYLAWVPERKCNGRYIFNSSQWYKHNVCFLQCLQMRRVTWLKQCTGTSLRGAFLYDQRGCFFFFWPLWPLQFPNAGPMEYYTMYMLCWSYVTKIYFIFPWDWLLTVEHDWTRSFRDLRIDSLIPLPHCIMISFWFSCCSWLCGWSVVSLD